MTDQAPALFGFLSQEAAAILLSLAGAILLGMLTIRSQRQVARARLTFETINRNNWDRDYIEKRADFIRLRDKKEGALAKFATAPLDGSDKKRADDVATIRAILNDYENMAIGIRQGILDEEYLYRYLRATTIRDWEGASPFAVALRNRFKIPLLYVEFEGLAAQWQNNMSYHKQNKPMPNRTRSVQVK